MLTKLSLDRSRLATSRKERDEVNCPENHLECDDLCSYRQGDKCHSPYGDLPRSIYDLMTHEELVAYLLKQAQPQPEWSGKQWDTVKQYKAMVLHLQKRLDEKEKETNAKKQPF